MFVAVDVESPALRIEESENIKRCEIACCVVEEHIFRAVVHGDAVGDEAARDRFGEIKDLLCADVREARDAVKISVMSDQRCAISSFSALLNQLREPLELC